MVKLFDTAGQEEYENLRQQIYKDVSSIILCYSVDDKLSFNNIEHFWLKEIQEVNARLPFVLCGMYKRIVKISLFHNFYSFF